MTHSATDSAPDTRVIWLETTAEDHRIARLAAAAIALSLVDAAIPLPLPGVKPGLANIVVLLVLYRQGFGAAAWVAGLRIVAGGLLLGYLLTPGFFLSLCGGICSLFMLAAAQHLPRRWFGPVTISVLAAFAHIGGQLLLARLWLIPHNGVFLLAPVFFATALFFGIINGLIVVRILASETTSELPQ